MFQTLFTEHMIAELTVKKRVFFPNSQMGLADHVNHSYARTLSDVSFISVTPRLQSSPIEIDFGQVSLFLHTDDLLLLPYSRKKSQNDS